MEWLEGDEESAMYDCPMWFSGECEDVGRILDKIKDISTRGSDMVTRKPNNPDRKEMIAESIELDGTEFKKIRILNLVDTTEIIYNPRDFEEYNQPFFTEEGVQIISVDLSTPPRTGRRVSLRPN